MFKQIIIATALTVAASSAMASNSIQGCGPSARIYLDQDVDNTTGHNEYLRDSKGAEVGFSLNWTFGFKKACEENNAAILAKKASELHKTNAQANASEVKAIADRLRLCSTFHKETAPGSIVEFCGDLLQ